MLRSGLCAAVLLIGLVVIAPAHGARLDRGFGEEGTAFAANTQQGELFGPAEAIAIDRRDRIVAIGSDTEHFGVQARFTTKGRLDSSFGKKGLLYVTDFRRTNPIGLAYDIATNSRNELLTTGALGYPFDDPSSPYQQGFVSKQHEDGSLVRSFADFGRLTVGLSGPTQAGIESRTISLGKSGRTVVAGRATHGSFRSGAFVARARRDGTGLDKTFTGGPQTKTGVRGIIELKTNEGHSAINDVKALPDGRILASGPSQGQFMTVRLRRNGSLDPSFGTNGIRKIDVDGDQSCLCSIATAMLRDRQNRVVVAGYTLSETSEVASIAVLRFTPDGRLDPSFGNAGISRPVLPMDDELEPDADRFIVTGMALQTDGKLVLSGERNARFSLVRLKSNGSLDTSFFATGIFTTWIRGTFGAATDVKIDSRGRILASGGPFDGPFAVVRIIPN